MEACISPDEGEGGDYHHPVSTEEIARAVEPGFRGGNANKHDE